MSKVMAKIIVCTCIKTKRCAKNRLTDHMPEILEYGGGGKKIIGIYFKLVGVIKVSSILLSTLSIL